jgi:hypothetical protein
MAIIDFIIFTAFMQCLSYSISHDLKHEREWKESNLYNWSTKVLREKKLRTFYCN